MGVATEWTVRSVSSVKPILLSIFEEIAKLSQVRVKIDKESELSSETTLFIDGHKVGQTAEEYDRQWQTHAIVGNPNRPVTSVIEGIAKDLAEAVKAVAGDSGFQEIQKKIDELRLYGWQAG